MTIRELARAKVNLTLCVLGRRPDGYHELESLVAFADAGDVVTVDPDGPDELTVDGPFGHGITGQNLLTKARMLLGEADQGLRIGSVHLEKRLPVAAGLGGGSADAAALLRAVRSLNAGKAPSIPWLPLAARLGSDVPVCLNNAPAMVWGRGEHLAAVAGLPIADAVLINPRLPLPTGRVFAALNRGPAASVQAPPPVPRFSGLAALVGYMRAKGNDMEMAAVGLLPEIAEVKALLAAQPGCQISAMSGSGPTCFGVFATAGLARTAATAIAAARPGWWVEATRLGGPTE